MSLNPVHKGKRAEKQALELMQKVINSVFVAHGLPATDAPCLERNSLAENKDHEQKGHSDILGLPMLSIEIKRREQAFDEAWWQQARRQCKKGQTPIVLYRQNREPWRCRLWGLLHDGKTWKSVPVDIKEVEFKKWLECQVKNYYFK